MAISCIIWMVNTFLKYFAISEAFFDRFWQFLSSKRIMKYARKKLINLSNWLWFQGSSILDEKASQKWEAFEVLTYLRAILNFFFKVSCKVGPSVRTSFHTSSNADESNVVRRFADATNTLGAIHILRKHLKGGRDVKKLSLLLIFSTKICLLLGSK